LALRSIDGGLLVQTVDAIPEESSSWRVVTRRPPTEAERAALAFAWRVCKHVKSNAIVLARGTEGGGWEVVGVGAGQMSRVDAVHLAVRKAGERAAGAVLASDAFFPFADNVEAAAAAGVTAIVQPGGSLRDADSIAAADRHGLAMLLTGIRHFRH
jgi:phosphoribosylaminoimidazolecarboxamide formyltransferase/IMP cyclohydrolase